MIKKTKLFCLPYAGGSAQAIYGKWSGMLNPNIELRPVELAGRGARIEENLYLNMEEAINDVLGQIKDEIAHGDYAFFGHSMGSILMYKILQRIEKLRLPPPIHAFFSGRRAPHMPSRKAVSHSKMNKEELENEILSLGGTPPEFFRYPELRNIFLPIIRSDFKIADTLVQKSEITQLDSDISILIGKDEDILAKEAKEWSLCTVRDCSINYFDGGHFFVLNQQKSVIDLINSCLIQRYSKEIV